MNIQKEQLDALNARLTVTLEADDYTPAYTKALKDYRKQMQLPGFRPGQVPMSVVKKRVGRAVLAEEINKVLSNSLHEYITEEKLEVLGQPMPVESSQDEGDWDNPDTFVFEYEMGLAPEIEIKLDKIKQTYYTIKVSDQMVDDEIQNLTRRFGAMSQPDESGDADMLMGTFIQLNAEGEIREGGIMHDSTISIEFIEDEGTRAALIGLKKDDTVDVDPHQVSRGQEDLGRMLGIEQDAIGQLDDSLFRFRVNEIRRLTPSEVDEALFDKVFGEGEVADEAAFRERISAQIGDSLKSDQDWLFKQQVSEAMIDKFDPQLPNAFLKRWIKATNEKPLEDDQLETEYPGYAKSVKWQLIEERIARQFEVKVEYPEILDYVKGNLASQYAQYGLPLDDETLEKYAANALSNQDEVRKIFAMLRENKVIEVAREEIKLKEKAVSLDDFKKLVEQQ